MPTKSSCSKPTTASFSFHDQIMDRSPSLGVNYWRNKLNVSQPETTLQVNKFQPFFPPFRQYSGVSKNFDSGAMAKVSDGYTVGSVANCIKDVITCKRMLQLRVKPLTHVELINALRFDETFISVRLFVRSWT
jgi:hypothetical protein